MTTGPTSEPFDAVGRHRVALTEHHSVTVDLPPGTDTVMFDVVEEEILTACREVAGDWAAAEGLDLDSFTVNTVVIEARDDRPAQLGVSWTVLVGHGSETDVPGLLGNWIWSGRIEHWLDVLTQACGRVRTGRIIARPTDGLASVTAMRHADHRTAVGVGTPPITPTPGSPLR